MIVGLTGGSGTGKSSAGAFFAKNGFVVADLDIIAREVCSPGTECLAEIGKAFENVIDTNGNLMRRKLGDMVFSDNEKLKLLNSITHKYIIKETNNFISQNSGKNIVLDAPLLFEAGLDLLCDVTVGILSKRENRIKRIVERDRLSVSQAEARIDSQPSDDFYISKCTFVLRNDSCLNDLADALCAKFGGLKNG